MENTIEDVAITLNFKKKDYEVFCANLCYFGKR